MNLGRVIWAIFKHSRYQHLGTCLGASLATMILVGALTLGDSVQATLYQQAEERVGQITHAFFLEDGHFHSDLADRIQATIAEDDRALVAPLVMSLGTLVSPSGQKRANEVRVLGIDERFFKFARDEASIPKFLAKGFWTSPDLGKELELKTGERMVLRMEEPGLFSRDAPLSGERDAQFVSWNLSSLGVLPVGALGNFSLRASMDPIRTVFVPLSLIQEEMFAEFDKENGRTDFANLLILKIDETIPQLNERINKVWSIEDAGLEVKKLRIPEAWSLRARQVFLSDSMFEKASFEEEKILGELTYLVNAIRHRKHPDQPSSAKMIPYSMVTGVKPDKGGPLPVNWIDQDIALNEWAANDLNASVGDEVLLEYFAVGKERKLLERSRTFKISKILPMPTMIPSGEESDWTPRFPGLSDAENCGEWDTGIPIKHKIRPKDEDYWDNFRGTPKAFISLCAAQEMWGNRWGRHTGLRIFGDEREAGRFIKKLNDNLSPANIGARLLSLQDEAKSAASGPIDFSQLFLAFGFFIVLAGLSLSGALFGFSVEQRNRQVGLFLALGYSVLRVRFMVWAEACFVCMVGSFLGVGWSWFFGKGVLWMLSGQWSGAVSGLGISYAPRGSSILLGTIASMAMTFLALIWSSWKQARQPPVALLNGGEFLKYSAYGKRTTMLPLKLGQLALFGAALGLLLAAWQFDLPMSPAFFGLGSLIVVWGIFAYKHHAKRLFSQSNRVRDNWFFALDPRSGRKAMTVGILAIGTFLVLGSGAFRKNQSENLTHPRSGTGGFSHILKTSMPVYDDLLGSEAIKNFDLNESLLGQIGIVPIRDHAGDDASCLNLNQSTRPPLYGVPLDEMEERFEFVHGNWLSLAQEKSNRVIPALVDQNTLLWALKKEIGDRIVYEDGEGKFFEVEIVAVVKGSILQGGIYLSDRNWVKKFPARGGFRNFWIAGQRTETVPAVRHLVDRLSNYGAHSIRTIDRINRLHAVENSYLSIFQALGGLGMLLGTIGLMIVILRNLWERRSEQATLYVLGYSPTLLTRMYERENLHMIAWGISIGCLAGFLGLLPSVIFHSQQISWAWTLGFGVMLFGLSLGSVKTAVFLGTKDNDYKILRNE